MIRFASDKRAVVCNQRLSQKRAETAKRYLMTQGVHPSRIFTEYHGIDYQTVEPAKVRRAELILMIRK